MKSPQSHKPLRAIRFSDLEWVALDYLALTFGYPSRHAYLRSLCIIAIQDDYKASEIIAPEYQETPQVN